MAAALVQMCVDPRLNHELIRAQVRQRLQRMSLSARGIYIVNEIGGNLGANFGNTLDLLIKEGEPVVLCAVFHHDDCVAERRRARAPLETTARQMAARLAESRIACPVLTGTILTQHSSLQWTDEPQPRYRPWSFGVY